MREAGALIRLAVPLAVSSLSQMAMGLTDTLLLGGLGSHDLAAGGLGANLFFTLMAILQGLTAAVGVLIAQGLGAARAAGTDSTRTGPLYGTGLAIALLLSVPMILLFGAATPLLRLVGQPAGIAVDTGRYLEVLRWSTPAALCGGGLLRAVLPALDAAHMLLWIMPGMAVLNAGLNWTLIHGGFGLPPLGLLGSALATTLTLWLSTILLFALLHGRRRTRRMIGRIGVSVSEAGRVVRLGLPILGTTAAEVGLFLVASLAAGTLGASALAAHQVVLSLCAFSFMVPMSIGQAANVRVGLPTGAGDMAAARRAGLVAMAVTAAIMCGIGLVLMLAPHLLAQAFLDPRKPGNAEAFATAIVLLRIAALFQIADGLQVTSLGALRGLGDATMPMLLATVGYWAIGFPVGLVAAFPLGRGMAGLWTGLAVALAAVAVMMTARFLLRTRPGAVAACVGDAGRTN